MKTTRDLDGRPLWLEVVCVVALASASHLACVYLVDGGLLPPIARAVSLCGWSASVAALLILRALPTGLSIRHWRRWIEWPMVFGGFVVVTAPFFASNLGRLPYEFVGGDDVFQVLWNRWWIDRAFRSGASIYFTDMVWTPTGSPLVFHFLIPVQSLLMALLRPFTGDVGAYNTMILASIPIAGTGAYAIGRVMDLNRSSSFVGGLVFAWCPFLTSKLGWPNMAYCGFLAFFVAALMRALPARGTLTGRREQAALALAVAAMVFTSDVIVIMAVNFSVCWLGFCAFVQRSPRQVLSQAVRICAPSAIVLAPYLGLVTSVALTWDITVQRAGAITPALASYVLPLATGSAYADWLFERIGGLNPNLGRRDLGCYLGVLVLPMAIAGWRVGRKRVDTLFWTTIFVTFTLLSMGSWLSVNHGPAEIFGYRVPMPFGVWKQMPIIGIVAQSGRYVVISHLALAVAVAMLLTFLRRRQSVLIYWGTVAATIGAVGADYAFVPKFVRSPPTPTISDRVGRILDVRTYQGETMFYQTVLERPLVGGYLSRPVPEAQRLYQSDPCLAWLMFKGPAAPCDATALNSAVNRFEISNVFLPPRDDRGVGLGRLGMVQTYRDDLVEVWSTPPTFDPGR